MSPTPFFKRNSKLRIRLRSAMKAHVADSGKKYTGSHKSSSVPIVVLEKTSTVQYLKPTTDAVIHVSTNDGRSDLPFSADFNGAESDCCIGTSDHGLGQVEESQTHARSLKCQEKVNRSGWKLDDICALLLSTAKRSGISDIVLGKLLRIIGLMVNLPRHTGDGTKPFPSSVFKLKALLGIDPAQEQQIIYICPGVSAVKLVAGKLEKEYERCGFQLTPGPTADTFTCELCDSVWNKKTLNKDGNHFATVPIHSILTRMMKQHGRYISSNEPLSPANNPAAIDDVPPVVMNDVTDGLRYRNMGVTRKDLVIVTHSDGAAISKSTRKKLYLTYVQCVNIPLGIRLPIWYLQQVWVGDDLPKDRECFLVELTRQLQQTQIGNPVYTPVKWQDSNGTAVVSPVYVLSYFADAPERTALNGQLPHSAAQGCIYCLQIAVSINGRLCYRNDPTITIKTHGMMKAMAQQFESTPPAERATMLKRKETNGFKRPSVIMRWPKFDFIEGFCIDVMHMFDEGVSRYLLEQLVDPNSVMYSTTTPTDQRTNLTRMDDRWLAIKVTGHNNRDVRSLRSYKMWKAHELRFFIQHGLPYVTKDLVLPDFYKAFCLVSRVAYICTKDSISEADLLLLQKLCEKFMSSFEKAFGVGEMKYSIHLVSHIWYAVQLYGPLHIVSCYGPEDQIGKTSRRILSMNNTTKHIMNNAIILNECTLALDCIRLSPEETDYRVLGEVRSALGLRSGLFVKTNKDGSCRLLGKDNPLLNEELYGRIRLQFDEHEFSAEQIYIFTRAQVESGIFVRTDGRSSSSCRNESIVMDINGQVVTIDYLFALVDRFHSRIVGTYVGGRQMAVEDASGYVGTKSVKVPHIFLLKQTETFYFQPTAVITKQLVILCKTEGGSFLSSPPSNRYRPT